MRLARDEVEAAVLRLDALDHPAARLLVRDGLCARRSARSRRRGPSARCRAMSARDAAAPRPGRGAGCRRSCSAAPCSSSARRRLQPVVQLVEVLLGLLDVARRGPGRSRPRLLAVQQLGELQVLAVDQLVQADLDVPRDRCRSRARARRRPRRATAAAPARQSDCSTACAVGQAVSRRAPRVPAGAGDQVEEDRRLPDGSMRRSRPVSTTKSRRCSVLPRPSLIDAANTSSRHGLAARAGRRRPRRAAGRRATRSTTSSRTASNSGWPGVTHSSVGSVAEQRLVEDDLLVLPAQPAEPRLQPLADRPEVPRHPADAVDVRRPCRDRLGREPAIGRRLRRRSPR